ncbi:hypothetical protein, partial [Pseudomonas syringae]|uniref:hypothetical protein n=1 Tax=Pseudomonas syringae TaxID=317 RepID=UPI001F25AC59
MTKSKAVQDLIADSSQTSAHTHMKCFLVSPIARPDSPTRSAADRLIRSVLSLLMPSLGFLLFVAY